MHTKQQLLRLLNRYDDEKGIGRRYLYGDPLPIRYLRAVLALPHISNETVISLPTIKYELGRLGLGVKPEEIYTNQYFQESGKSATLLRQAFAEPTHLHMLLRLPLLS